MTAGSGIFDARDDARRVLPPLGWLFVAMALVEAWLVVQTMHLELAPVPGVIVSGDTGTPLALVYGLANVATVLLPAAMLYRVPSAGHSYPLLLLGAALIATWTLAVAAFGWWAGQAMNPEQVVFASNFAPIATLVRIIGLALIALGLLRVRSGWPRPRAILATLVAIAIALLPTTLMYVVLVGMAGSGASIPLVELAPAGLDLLAEALIGAWLGVAVGAWLDGERPRAFWVPLAVVSVALLAVDVLQTVQLLTESGSTAWLIDGFGTQLWIGAVSALVTLAVFALALPSRSAD